MIKVCMIVHGPYYSDGRVRGYAEALVDAGLHVDVLSLRDKSQPFATHRNGIKVFTIPLERSYRGLGNYFIEYGLAFFLFSFRLLMLHIQNRYKVIHVHNMPDFFAFVALIPRVFGAKLILDIHDPMPEFYMSKYKIHQDSLAVRLLRIQEKLSIWITHAVIAANLNFKNNLIKRGIPASKITVITNVPDPTLFNPNGYQKESRTHRSHFTLIYPGTIAPRYGLDVAIRALPVLIKRIPHLRLIIIGPYVEYVHELAALAEHHGVSAFVQFKPAVPVDEVARQLIQADVGIYPALPDPHMNIAIPCKVLEYAAMNVPIVASRLKVLEDLFPDTAVMFFEPGNVHQFALRVIELYEKTERRQALVQHMNHLFVHNYSWDDERRVYLDLLYKLFPPQTPEA